MILVHASPQPDLTLPHDPADAFLDPKAFLLQSQLMPEPSLSPLEIHKRSKRVRLITHYVLAACLFCIVWGLLWMFMATRYRSNVEKWIEVGRSAGNQISYEDGQIYGFPDRVIMRFTNLKWKNADGIESNIGTMDLGAILWHWDQFSARFKNHAEITAPLENTGYALTLSGDKGSAEVHLTKDGLWTYSRINLDQAEIGRAPNYLFHADKLTAQAERPENDPTDHHEAGLTLSGTARKVTGPIDLSKTFGAEADEIGVGLRIMGPVPDFRKKDAVARWNSNSGIVEFDTLHFDWGPLLLEAEGTLGFDDEFQPEGAFASTIGKQEDLLKALMQAGFIAQNQETMLNSAMKIFAKPSQDGAIKGIGVPITVQLGGLFLGPVKIYSYPPIEWPPTEQPPSANKPAQ